MVAVAEKRIISSEAFRHVERELYCYQETKKELERAREEIIERGLGEIDDRTRVQIPSEWASVTENKATALLLHKGIRHMTDVVEAIEAALEKLDAPQKRMVALRYWEKPGAPWKEIAEHPDVSADESTCRRWRGKIVEMIALRLGWF